MKDRERKDERKDTRGRGDEPGSRGKGRSDPQGSSPENRSKRMPEQGGSSGESDSSRGSASDENVENE
jgi:hypothetical protein